MAAKNNISTPGVYLTGRGDCKFARLQKDMRKNWTLYLLVIPVVLFYAVFCYGPMYGVILAFKEFNPSLGILWSDWVGFQNFSDFFNSAYSARIIRNTFNISLQSILWGFPAPIILALLINEVSSKLFKKTVQTITYLPHFISVVVICGMVRDFVASDGIINIIVELFGGTAQNMLDNKDLFVPIYIIKNIWQGVGWGSIIYLAAITGIDQELYEAAIIDGANRWKQTLHVTLPSIAPTIITLLILRMGSVMNVGFESIILLYNDRTMEAADVISSFVYRYGLLNAQYGYASAVGLFNSVINCFLLVSTNIISKKLKQSSLW